MALGAIQNQDSRSRFKTLADELRKLQEESQREPKTDVEPFERLERLGKVYQSLRRPRQEVASPPSITRTVPRLQQSSVSDTTSFDDEDVPAPAVLPKRSARVPQPAIRTRQSPSQKVSSSPTLQERRDYSARTGGRDVPFLDAEIAKLKPPVQKSIAQLPITQKAASPTSAQGGAPSRFQLLRKATPIQAADMEQKAKSARIEQIKSEREKMPWYGRRWEDIKDAGAAMRNYGGDVGRNVGEVVGGITSGNYEPFFEQAEGLGQGLLKLGAMGAKGSIEPGIGESSQRAYETSMQASDTAINATNQNIAKIQERQAKRREHDPDWQASRTTKERIAEREAASPGMASKVTRGITKGAIGAVPYGAAVLSGGGIPAVIGLTALQQDYTRPEEAMLNVATSALPIGAARAATPAIRSATEGLKPLVRSGVRAAGQIGIGSGTNVAQKILTGETDPTELTEAAITGGALSLGDAISQSRVKALKSSQPLRRQAIPEPTPEAIAMEMQAPTKPLTAVEPTRITEPIDAKGAKAQRGSEALPIEEPAPRPIQDQITEMETERRNLSQQILDEATPGMTPAKERVNAIGHEVRSLKLQQRAARIEGVEPIPASEIDSIVNDAKQAAEAAGRPIDGKVWDANEKRIRELATRKDDAGKVIQQLESEIAKADGEAAPPQVTASERLYSKLDELETSARARLNERRQSAHRTTNTDLGADLADYAIIGAAKMGKGAINFADYSEAMLDEFGDGLKPQLKQLYTESRKLYSDEKSTALRQPEDIATMTRRLEAARRQSKNADTLLNQKLRQIERTSLLDTATALRKAGLLTGVKTHLRNVGGTGAFQIAEEISRIPASIADIAISTFSKQRGITGLNARAIARSGYEAATKGVKEAWQIIRKGATEEDLQRLQLDREVNTGSKILDTYVNGVFRLLSAEDKVFRTYAMRRSLEDRARVQALNEVKQGTIKRSDVTSRTQELIDSPPEDMAAGALADAEIATFNNENIVSEAMSGARKAIRKREGGQAADFAINMALPFTKTPTNILARILDYSPVGFGKNARQVANAIASKSFTPAEQRAFSQTFGRASTGTAIIMLGYKLGAAGLMTGMSEDDRGKRERDKAAGRSPGAVLNPLTNTWHQVAAVSPIGNLLTIGASIAREHTRKLKNEDDRAANYLKAAGKTIAEQPMLSTVKDVTEALESPKKISSFGGRMAGSFVPTLVSDVGELIDTRRENVPGFKAQIQKRVPIWRESLPEAKDVFGERLEDRATSLFDPTLTGTAKERTDTLIKELVRLDVGIAKRTKKGGESDAQTQRRQEHFGRKYRRYGAALADSSVYKSADDETKRKAFALLNDRLGDENSRLSKVSPFVLIREAREPKEKKGRNRKRSTTAIE